MSVSLVITTQSSCDADLNEAKVAGVPGRATNQARKYRAFLFSAEDDAIEQAASQLEKAFG